MTVLAAVDSVHAHWPPQVQEAFVHVQNARLPLSPDLPVQCCCAWCGRPRSNGIPALIPIVPDDYPGYDPNWRNR